MFAVCYAKLVAINICTVVVNTANAVTTTTSFIRGVVVKAKSVIVGRIVVNISE